MTDPLDPDFWGEEAGILYNILFPLFRDAAVASALSSYTELAGMVDLGLSWDVVNTAAISWAEQYTEDVVNQISQTSMTAFLNNYEEWVLSGDPISALIETLEPYYGEIRAEMVAITEVTRAYASGNIAAWQLTGMVTGFNVQTAEDDVVCPICEEERDRGVHELTDDPPPYHVRCRCWLTPVL